MVKANTFITNLCLLQSQFYSQYFKTVLGIKGIY